MRGTIHKWFYALEGAGDCPKRGDSLIEWDSDKEGPKMWNICVTSSMDVTKQMTLSRTLPLSCRPCWPPSSRASERSTTLSSTASPPPILEMGQTTWNAAIQNSNQCQLTNMGSLFWFWPRPLAAWWPRWRSRRHPPGRRCRSTGGGRLILDNLDIDGWKDFIEFFTGSGHLALAHQCGIPEIQVLTCPDLMNYPSKIMQWETDARALGKVEKYYWTSLYENDFVGSVHLHRLDQLLHDTSYLILAFLNFYIFGELLRQIASNTTQGFFASTCIDYSNTHVCDLKVPSIIK